MVDLHLFPRDKVIGIFRGFSEGGLEFHADIVLPYKNEFQSMPMHGQFILIQLASDDEAVLGRITSLSAEGRLASGPGEDFSIRAVRGEREIAEDLREDYLKYRVNIRVLGVLRRADGRIVFAASHRRLPHVGSKVAWPSEAVLKEIVGHNAPGADLGYYALGEYVYAGADPRLKKDDVNDAWMQVKTPTILARFAVENLVSKRTFIFARAGYGKSNLTKLLFSDLYSTNPTIQKRDRQVPVGTVIFDVDGEYFWPDDKGRPGLCDVPELEEKIVVFSDKAGPSGFYQSFLAGNIRLDIRRLPPADVIAIALTGEQQNHQNVRKLRGLTQDRWERLVNLIDREGGAASVEEIQDVLNLPQDAGAEATAAKSNMLYVVRLLHSASSQMLDMLMEALREGKLCIVDVSRLRGKAALVLSGIILKHIFDHNMSEFTKAKPATIPTIAVLEEAQSVLGHSADSGENPYTAWVKEGRKFDLGAVMITQQPGSINNEILSQGDNWFIFHLLSASDLQNVRKANAHFSEDLLSSLLNEPLHGHGVFWSSAAGRAYPIPLRVLSFEKNTTVRDPQSNAAAVHNYASRLREKYRRQLDELQAAQRRAAPGPTLKVAPGDGGGPQQLALTTAGVGEGGREPPLVEEVEVVSEPEVDVLHLARQRAIQALNESADFRSKMDDKGIPWMGVQSVLRQNLPQNLDNSDDLAYRLVPEALNTVLGAGAWKTEKRPKVSGPGETTWIVRVKE